MSNNFFGLKSTQIMDHPLFQRLRYILQNDAAHYVFPGATHTRFSHGIGVMHIAGKIFESLIHQYYDESKGFEIKSEHEKSVYLVCQIFE
jgi:HD superfamily phosphohydrolase